jgi:hypothetical protein
MNTFYENDYDTDENENGILNDYTPEIIAEFEEDNKLSIINFYKEKLSKEPEFIGIKNISCGKILNIIENIHLEKLNKNDYELNEIQYNIFNDMYLELSSFSNIKKTMVNNVNFYNLITKQIFNIIYV